MDPTKVFSTARVETRCLALTGGMTVKDVADACRSAALGFAWGADRGWGRRELARWLVGPYARAVAVSHSARSGVRRSVQYRPLHEGTIHDLLVRAHAYLLDGLRVAWTWRKDAAFAREMIDEGIVVGVVDSSSAIGYAPVDGFDMRLVDRVRSLFVADYLTRPIDYESFIVCDQCGGATFDGAVAHMRSCDAGGAVTLRRRSVRTFRVETAASPVFTPDCDEGDRATLVGLG